MPHVYILPDTGGYMYHFFILELSLLRNFKKYDSEDKIYISMPHLKKYNQSYMYEAIKYFEPEIELLDNIDTIPNIIKINIEEHEPLINRDRNKVSSDAILYLRNTFLKNKTYNLEKNKYVYISREDSELLSNNTNKVKRRQILNEKELYVPLTELGFEIVKLQNLSLEEKIKLFQTSSLIIGPEGSNLSLTFLANKDTKIICICYILSFLQHTYHLANSIEIEFINYSDVERINVNEDSSGMSDNMIIDVNKFITYIRGYIN